MATSRTRDEIEALATELLQNGTATKLVNYIADRDCQIRLVKPLLSCDASAIALSFLPAAGEPTAATTEKGKQDDACSYHHLRQGLADTVLESGTGLAARYVVPSAHVTIARFVSKEGVQLEVNRDQVSALVKVIEDINKTLKKRFWPQPDADDAESTMPAEGEWVVGEEQGLEMNKGTSWYGDGENVLVGNPLGDEITETGVI